jgi:tRNA(Ile)-lysidine synthase
LLPFCRDEIVVWLAGEGIAWREDASNRDPAFARNRVRFELLPLLESFNPAIRMRLNELCRQLADDEDDWAARAAAELRRGAELGQGECRLPCAVLAEASPAMAGRLVRAAFKAVRGDLRRLDADHVKAVLALAVGPRPQGELSLPGVWVGRRYDQLLLRQSAPGPVRQVPFAIAGPGRYLLADGRTLGVELVAAARGEGAHAVEFCADEVAFPLLVRAPQPGDRLHPAGMSGTKKLQDLFVDCKLDKEGRAAAVLVFAGGEMLWVVGLRRVAGCRPRDTGPVLRLELFEAELPGAQSA